MKNQQKRQYSSGKSCLGILDKLLFCFPTNEVPSITNPNSLNLEVFRNKIDSNCQSHKNNLKLIANSLEKSSISEEQKTIILLRASDFSNKAIDIINNLDDVCSKGVPALDKVFNGLKLGPSFAQVEMNPSQAADLTKAGLKIAKSMVPPIVATALGSAAFNSKTCSKFLKFR